MREARKRVREKKYGEKRVRKREMDMVRRAVKRKKRHGEKRARKRDERWRREIEREKTEKEKL